MPEKKTAVVLLAVVVALIFTETFALPLPTHPVTDIAFGSCNAHNRNQEIWKSIVAAKPDLFVWLGDVVYADTPLFPLYWTSTPLDKMKEKFDAQKHSPTYAQLREQTPIVGVWDDHDYGKNNGGAEYQDRAASQTIFMDFIDEPIDSERRSRPGIYTSYYLAGPETEKDVNLILLDVRYHKTGSMGEGDMLGEEQWEWLEAVLSESPSKVHIIGSGIQVTPFQKPVQEAWSSHPQSRQRLFDLFVKLRVPGVILLSGDVHYSEVLRVPAECSGTGYPIHEFTSSGLTHTCNGMLGNCKFFLDHFFNTPFHYGDSFYADRNWGSLHFDWINHSIALRTHDLNGHIVHQALLDLHALQVPTTHASALGIGALSRCDGPPNYFLLIPFESYKYVLFLIPISAIAFAFFVLRKLFYFFQRSSITPSDKAKLRKLE